jgi:ammonia channel protein AmtB
MELSIQPAVIRTLLGGRLALRLLKGVAFTVVFAGSATYILLNAVDNLVGIRLIEEQETLRLDLSQHGESAYND